MTGDYQPVHTLLENSADRRPDAVALVHGERSWTYAQVEEEANRTAALLIEQGVSRGDRIALLVENGIEYVTGLFGILKAGGCAVALTGANQARTNRDLLQDSGSVGLLTRAVAVRNDLPDLVRDVPDLRFVLLDRTNPKWDLPEHLVLLTEERRREAATARPDTEIGADDLCLILYTSGSTGRPRGVTLTHRNLAANTRQILAYLELTSADSVLAVLPFHYSFGNSLLMTHFAVGGRVVLDNRFAYPQTVLETLRQEEVSSFSGVPSTFAILAAKTSFLESPPPSLRYLTQAGGGMAPALVKRVREAFRDRAELFVMYGQTEASARLSYVPPAMLDRKLGSIGIPIPGVELKVLRPDGGECDVDEVGEVVARGDNIMQGYWRDPAETELVLRDGALLTGDLGRRDADGYLFLVDRIKNMIKAGANRVSSREVEDAISELTEVVEVCVVGVSDPLLGEAIEAHIVLREDSDLDPKAISRHLQKLIAPFKMPRNYHFHSGLPKNSSGKTMKSRLKNIK